MDRGVSGVVMNDGLVKMDGGRGKIIQGSQQARSFRDERNNKKKLNNQISYNL
jgi:hypothetical protein